MKTILMLSLFLGALTCSAAATDGLPVESLVRKDEQGNEIPRGDVSKISFFAEGKFSVLAEVPIAGGAYETVWTQYDFQGHWEANFWGNQPLRQCADNQWLYWNRDVVNFHPDPYLGFHYYNSSGGIRDLAVLPGGKLLIPGYFESSPQQNDFVPRLATLAEGFEDTGNVSWVSSEIFPRQESLLNLKVYPLADGSYFVYDSGGNPYDPVAARRVSPNATVQTFISPSIHGVIEQVWQQADGKLLLSGTFTVLIGNTDMSSHLIRLLSDGSYDASFQGVFPAHVENFALQADGKIIAAEHTNYGARISRFFPNGTVDPGFPAYEPGQNLRVALAPNGRIYAFDTTGGYAHPSAPAPIMRLSNGLPVERLTVAGNTIRWMRGGSVPEINWVEFELANEDGTWTNLGTAQRIAGGWEMTTTLPTAGRLRAYSYHHTSLVNEEFRQEAHFGPAPLPDWKLDQLGNAAAADMGDPDGDAIPSLIEYGLASDPNTPNTAFTLQSEPGQPMCLVLRRSAKHFDVDLTIEATNDPSSPWETLAQSLNGGPTQGQGFTHEAELDAETAEYQCFICDSAEFTLASKRFYRVRVERR